MVPRPRVRKSRLFRNCALSRPTGNPWLLLYSDHTRGPTCFMQTSHRTPAVSVIWSVVFMPLWKWKRHVEEHQHHDFVYREILKKSDLCYVVLLVVLWCQICVGFSNAVVPHSNVQSNLPNWDFLIWATSLYGPVDSAPSDFLCFVLHSPSLFGPPP